MYRKKEKKRIELQEQKKMIKLILDLDLLSLGYPI